MRSLIQVFIRHCEQWHDVHLSLPLSVLRRLSPAKNRLPRLRSLTIDACIDDLPWEKVVDTFECAPQLQCLILSPNIDPSMLKISWSQLKHCVAEERCVDDCLEYLRLTPNVEKCAIRPISLHSRRNSHPVQLSHLRSIDIQIGARGDPANIFDRLLVPALREISIWLGYFPWTSTPQLISLLSRCSLEKFRFYACDDHPCDDDTVQFLQASPSLLELDLLGSSTRCITKSFLTRFAYSENSTICTRLVPKLHTIRIHYAPSHFDILGFANALQSRMMLSGNGPTSRAASVAVLRTVEIHYSADEPLKLNPTALFQLRQLRDLGLNIRVLYGRECLL
jgi:hypothetical protein